MPTYSVLLTSGWRADCEGKRISDAMKNLASKRPDLIPIMTPSFITYINGVSSYGFRQTNESRSTCKRIKSSSAKKYEVQTYTLCDGWVNCWSENDEPLLFDSEEEAQNEIDDFLRSCTEANLDGYYRDDYRIAQSK